jgi:hypothetical protein
MQDVSGLHHAASRFGSAPEFGYNSHSYGFLPHGIGDRLFHGFNHFVVPKVGSCDLYGVLGLADRRTCSSSY